MKLYNKTRIPDSVLEPMLLMAGRSVGARTAEVVVVVTQNRSPRVSGTAHECIGVAAWRLFGANTKREHIRTDGGFFYLRLPRKGQGNNWSDPIWLATETIKIAAHEWAHIRDYQAGGRSAMAFARTNPRTGRRPRHDSRPEELRAVNATDDAVAKGLLTRDQDIILNFAIALEEQK